MASARPAREARADARRAAGMRASYRRTRRQVERADGTPATAEGWEGVVRDTRGAVVHACGHVHRNRDAYSSTGGRAARECAGDLLGAQWEGP